MTLRKGNFDLGREEFFLRVLIVEDDRKLAGFIRDALCEQDHAVDMAHDGEEGWLLAGTEAYDIIVLDIMLPKRSG